MAISTIDIITPFDPTGFTQLSGAQLQQLVSGIAPYTNVGFFLLTEDDNQGNPTVPDPTALPSTAKWAAYGWLRVSANGVALYIWNPVAASSATLLQWQIANISSIPTGSITGSQIAALTITDNNIFSVGWNKLSSGGAVGGCLTGSLPNPALANNVVGGSNIAPNSVSGGLAGSLALSTIILANMVPGTLNNTAFGTTDTTNLMDNQIMSIAQVGGGLNPVGALGKLQISGGSAGQVLTINTAATQAEWDTPAITKRSTVNQSAGLGTLLTNLTVPGVVITFAHTLGAIPSDVKINVLCLTNDAASGYTAGQLLEISILELGLTGSVITGSGLKWFADATNVYVITYGAGSSDTFAWLLPTTGGAWVKATAANNFCIQTVAFL